MSDILKGDDFTENWNPLQVASSNVKSRYGRIHKPKLSNDFINYDPGNDGRVETILEKHTKNKSDSPETPILQINHIQYDGRDYSKLVNKNIVHVTADSIIEEFDDDYESPIALNERRFFKSPNKHFKSQYIHDNYMKNNSIKLGNGNGNSTPVNMTDVLKIVTSKSPENYEEGHASTRKPLKTYGKKKKSTDNIVLETFGLPDDPLLPFLSMHDANDECTVVEEDKRLINDWEKLDKKQLENNEIVQIDEAQKEDRCDNLDDEKKELFVNVTDLKLSKTTEVMSVISQVNKNEDFCNAENEIIATAIEDDFKVGDLAWARIGTKPYWPCLCIEEPNSNLFVKKIGKVKQHIMHHVQFFGDNGRRAWIHLKKLLHFHGKEDMDLNTVIHSKKFRPYFMGVRSRWEVGVDEAVSMLHKNFEERFQFFHDMFQKIKSAKLEKAAQRKAEEAISSGIINNNNVKDESKISEIAVMNHKKELTNSSPTSSQGKGKRQRQSLDNKYNTRPKRHKINVTETDSNKDPSMADIVDTIELQTEMKVGALEELEALYKRNNLFKGIYKEKVCQICTEKNDVFKCHLCYGSYHIKCQENLLGPNPEKTPLGIGLVQIIDIKSKQGGNYPIKITSDLVDMNLDEKIDLKMKEIMCDFDGKNIVYADSTTDSSGCEDMLSTTQMDYGVHAEETNLFKCCYCTTGIEPPCSICLQYVSKKQSKILQKCSMNRCRKYYHSECLKACPQTRWSVINRLHKDSNEYLDTFACPTHFCHTCFVDSSEWQINTFKVARCIKCAGVYHTTNYCLPAGTQILSASQIICPRHTYQSKRTSTINTNWCFICSKGGKLICCETCPTSVHTECIKMIIKDEDSFICEDCESGRFPLYNEVVWVKLGCYRWWPARIIFPNEIPDRVVNHSHEKHDFVVKFFGTNDYNWIGRGRVFLFDEGDYKETFTTFKSKMDVDYRRALEEATIYYKINKEFKTTKLDIFKNTLKPPPYIRIKANKSYGNVKSFDGNISNTTSCECKATDEFPCGPDSDCLNRLLLTECNPEVCPAGSKCTNQQFEKRLYPPLVPYKTNAKGWGLKCLESLHKGQFVIEYVGEMIGEQEYQRRIKKMNEQKNDNYYFLIIDKDRIIDAGPKGNLSRFMNHSCQPNCETQKWTVNGDTRVGLFTLQDVAANEELTFNYNLEYIGKEKKECKCSAPNCKGYIGVQQRQKEKQKKVKKKKIEQKLTIPQVPVVDNVPCFVCGIQGNVAPCNNKICNKYYHLHCLNMEIWPEGRWICPWHNCNVCTKRTIRCCVMCINSYCPSHADGNIKHHKLLGFLCSKHDSQKSNDTSNVATQEEVITSTTDDGDIMLKSIDTIDKETTANKELINGDISSRKKTTSIVNMVDNNETNSRRSSKRLTNIRKPKNSKSQSKLRNSKKVNNSGKQLAKDINR